MSEAAHTHGPGVWIRDTGGYHLVTAHSGRLAVLTSAINPDKGDWEAPGVSCLFARVGDPTRLTTLTPDHPDARLIAAAPELLEILEHRALPLVQLLAAKMNNPKQTADAIEAIFAIIAKAKGEQA